ncbi:hypothetical protein HDU87_003463 [Geranomyces variabilis]|uniref:Uncharacterized protein n=1 Tax=Geranomyces variabilis TaxID=109894 RepID=A0AAD5TLB8_9FUNG|nr:hypothetical protein HDU87_003463 [Geranomyces variabilis]
MSAPRNKLSRRIFLFVSLAALGAHSAAAYGRIGHWLTGEVAQQLLSPSANNWTHIVLPQYGGSLALAALWADEVKPAWSSPHHYVNPATDCSPLSTEPCNCILTAIANHTARLIAPLATTDARSEALKFAIHYIGDIHQPLHVSGRFKGGTQMTVVFDKRTVSLHEVWDYLMLEHRQKSLGLSRTAYAQHLLANHPAPSRCPASNPAPPFDSNTNPLPLVVCPQLWGSESVLLNCDTVWKGLSAASRNTDLADEYYARVIDVVEAGVVAAGYRIAAVIEAAVVAIEAGSHETDGVLVVQT